MIWLGTPRGNRMEDEMVGHHRGNRMEEGMRWLGIIGATEWKRG